MVLVKPATVVQWRRQGFRLFWRWRSRSGRPAVNREIRDLIRQMSSANLWLRKTPSRATCRARVGIIERPVKISGIARVATAARVARV